MAKEVLRDGVVRVRVGRVSAQPALLEGAVLVARTYPARAARHRARDRRRHPRDIVVDPAVVFEPGARQPSVPVHAAHHHVSVGMASCALAAVGCALSKKACKFNDPRYHVSNLQSP